MAKCHAISLLTTESILGLIKRVRQSKACNTLNSLLSKEISINGDGRMFDFREINEGDIHEAICRIKVKQALAMITSLAISEDYFSIYC